MEFNESGYITNLTTEEAVEIIETYLFPAQQARQSGKTICYTNMLTAWNKVRSELHTLDEVRKWLDKQVTSLEPNKQ